MVLKTERLILRELREADFSALGEILMDREVMYAYGHCFSEKETMEWLERQRERYRRFGFGLWGAVLKATGEVIGQAGLTIQPCEGREVLEIGYLFKKKHWHFGYAREAAEGCKRYAFDILNREKVYSIIKTDNYPSIRVAESIGMKREKEFITRYYGGNMRHYLFSVRKEEKEYV